ncbi:MAG: hypothetical protein M3314_12895 [Actinomycetota bacterium]|nr:hypothetical protein [Actinomycetota bacterium]
MLIPREARGSVLLLFPAGVLVVMVLAAIAVDASIAFLGERELAAAVAGAANDAATEAISDEAFYGAGQVELDDAEVARVAEERVRTSLDAGRHQGLDVRASVVRTSGGCPSLEVEASATVRYLFARALPGGPDEARVASTASSSPLQEDSRC